MGTCEGTLVDLRNGKVLWVTEASAGTSPEGLSENDISRSHV